MRYNRPEINPTYMKAVLPDHSVHNGRNYSCEKELVNSYAALALVNDSEGTPQVVELIDCRLWMARSKNASVVYCGIWVHDNCGTGLEFAGHGSAGGGGYHKESAAVEAALESAGITLYGSPYNRYAEPGSYESIDCICGIGGCGDQAIKTALTAICNALGYGRVYIV